MLEGLLWTVLALISVLVAALAVPVEVMARVYWGERKRVWFRITWLFGLLRLQSDMGGEKPRAARKKPRKKKKKKKRPAGKPSLAVLRRGFRLLRDLIGRIGIRRLELDLALGSDDPATTGEMVGFSAPFVALANSLPHTSVTLSPDFGGARFDGIGAGEIRVQPIRLLPPLFAFALSPEVRRWLLIRR
jgi:hypothetical protein